MASVTNAKSTISIAPSGAIPTTAAAYKALTWTVINDVEEIGGEFGDTYAKVEAKVLGTRRVRKGKGSVDGGAIELTVLRDAADAGQSALRTALASDDRVFIKIELGDKPAGANATGSTAYMPVLVFSAPVQGGDADSYVKQVFTLEIDGETVTAAPAAGV
ncbi:hypothetical protein [Hansschlegelia zhihuaiae]|uniref:Uncharacterized protein n=1 Tax=Hansschlegelia zhihuaiae TaxID=405005 RepID=A0A4Q0M7Z9_9HYPH|nr:hypothetical protein [Hansschlegelia zhihuaiae]RXF69231.1 hypothetical protein EK403_18775 [Hansschlegelia zhihuaiae]